MVNIADIIAEWKAVCKSKEKELNVVCGMWPENKKPHTFACGFEALKLGFGLLKGMVLAVEAADTFCCQAVPSAPVIENYSVGKLTPSFFI